MANIDRTLGKLEKAVEKLEELAKNMADRLDTVESERDQERGGRKMLMLLGAGVATGWGIVGAFVGDHVKGWLS